MATKKPAAKKAARKTTKRKFSPAQLAAQKLFAERARAGKLAKERAHHQASGKRRKSAAKKASPPRRTANPLHHTKVRAPLAYHVCHAVHGVAGKAIAAFESKARAVEYGKAYVKAHGKPVVIVGKGL